MWFGLARINALILVNGFYQFYQSLGWRGSAVYGIFGLPLDRGWLFGGGGAAQTIEQKGLEAWFRCVGVDGGSISSLVRVDKEVGLFF